METANPQHIAALLAYYRDIGVDEIVADDAIDLSQSRMWRPPEGSLLAQSAAPSAAAAASSSPRTAYAPIVYESTQTGQAGPGSGHHNPERPGHRDDAARQAPATGTGARPASPGVTRPGWSPAPLMGDSETIEAARTTVEAADTLDALRERFSAFDGCPLRRTATSFVFADGAADAALMIIGEAPGEEEDRQGKPFVGRAGQLLDRMIGAIGLDRQSVYISNILPWRPPGNRTPSASEIATCLPYIQRHIALKRPRILICAGGISAKALLNSTKGITRLRGQWAQVPIPGLDAPLPAMPLFHPAYLLRQPAQKRLAWRDLLMVQKALGEINDRPQAIDSPE